MRITYFIAAYGSQFLGQEIHRELLHVLQQRGHTVQVFALAGREQKIAPEQPTCEDGIPVFRAPMEASRLARGINAITKPVLHYGRFSVGWWALRDYLRRNQEIDLILAEGAYPFGAMAALAASARGPKLAISVAGGDFIDSRAAHYGYGRFRTARRLMRYAFQRAAAVRVTTPLVRERVLALGASPEKTALIPRNIASYCFPPETSPLEQFRQEQRAAIAAKYAIQNAHILVAAGRLLPIKGFDTLIRALPQVEARAGDTRLLVIGPNRFDSQHGDYLQYLQALARECGVQDRVIFTGAIPHQDMRGYLAAADLIAVPSVLEGMNKIVVEGAAVGTPSVVTRTAGIADLMDQTVTGAIVEPNDAGGLGEKISALLNDPARRVVLGARGVEWARQFSSEVIGAQLIALCERLAANS